MPPTMSPPASPGTSHDGTPVTVRTTSTLNGTVWWAQGNYVVLTLENGENKEYQVPESFLDPRKTFK